MVRSRCLFLQFGVESRARLSVNARDAARQLGLLPLALALCVVISLGGCAAGTPKQLVEPGAAGIASSWQAPLPHDGKLADLSLWWAQFGDPLLLRLIESGQRVSPTVAHAGARIAEARTALVTGRASLLPSVSAVSAGARGRASPDDALATTSSLGLLARWELDVFGANRARADAAQARLDGSTAAWHDARVSAAAEVALGYLELRACEAQRIQAEVDAESRAEISRLTALAVKTGLQPPSAAQLAQASAAQGNAALASQRAQCDLIVKSIVALTSEDESALRRDLEPHSALLPKPVSLLVGAVPAEVVARRPDILAAAREVMAASADIAQAKAQRMPSISVVGSIETMRLSQGSISTDGTVWRVGPIAVTMPIFDSGVRSARVAAEQARYDAAGAAYLARLREAVREVEAALVRLQSSAARRDSLRVAAIGFQGSFTAAEARYRAGVSSLFELEDARRSMVAANSALIDEHREAVAAWIALYRAIGGGWSPPEPANAVSGLSGGTTLQAESRRLPPAGRHRLE